MSFINELLKTVNTQVDQYTFEGYNAIVSLFSTTLMTLLVIYFAGLGWLVIRGLIPLTPMAVAWHMLKAAFIFAFALHWDYFSFFFVDFFVHGTDRLIGAVLSTDGQTGDPVKITTLLSNVWESGNNLFAGIWRASGPDFLLGTLMGFVGYAAITGMTAIALFYIIMSKVALSVLLVLAPVILPLYLWQPTRAVFNGWIQLLVQWMLTPLLLYAFLGLFIKLVQTRITDMAALPGGPTTASISAFVLLSIIIMATFRQAGIMSRDLSKKIKIDNGLSAGESVPSLAFKALREGRK